MLMFKYWLDLLSWFWFDAALDQSEGAMIKFLSETFRSFIRLAYFIF